MLIFLVLFAEVSRKILKPWPILQKMCNVIMNNRLRYGPPVHRIRNAWLTSSCTVLSRLQNYLLSSPQNLSVNRCSVCGLIWTHTLRLKLTHTHIYTNSHSHIATQSLTQRHSFTQSDSRENKSPTHRHKLTDRHTYEQSHTHTDTDTHAHTVGRLKIVKRPTLSFCSW